jgi:antitoxin component of MazEF toxin-antitoxin module
MRTRLTRVGDDIVIMLDEETLGSAGLTADSDIDMFVHREVLYVARPEIAARKRAFLEAVDQVTAQYDDVFRRLSES